MRVVLTEKNLEVLKQLAKYYVLKRSMIQEMSFPKLRSPRALCERLRKLTKAGYCSVANMEVVLPGTGGAAPVYYPNKKTAETLAAVFGDPSYEKIYCKPPSTRMLFHWVEISRLHQFVDKANKASDRFKLHEWYNEWEPINKDENRNSERYSIYSEFEKVSCAPDAGFLLENRIGKQKVFYVEADRGTLSLKSVIKSKPRGYDRLFELQQHAKHFPQTDVAKFSILFVTTSEYRRDKLAKSADTFDPHGLWKFAWNRDVTPESFFVEPIWRGKNKTVTSLVTA